MYCGPSQVVQDGCWAWLSLIAAAMVQFIVMGIHNSFGIMNVFILKTRKWDASTSALIGSFALGLTFLISPIATQLCESYNPKKVTILGGVLSVVGLFGTSMVDKPIPMLLCYSVVWGTGSSLCYASSFVVVGKLFRTHLAFAMGFATAGSGIGGMAMPPSIQHILYKLDWKATFLILAVLASILILAALAYREPILGPNDLSLNRTSWRKLFDCSLWCIPAFTILTISLVIFNFGYYVPIIHVAKYATDHDISKTKSPWLLSFMSASSVVARLLFGKLADHPRVNKFVIFHCCLCVMGLSTTLFPLVKLKYANFVMYMVIFGTCEGCIVGTVSTLVAHVVGRQRLSPAIGLLFFSVALPLTAGPSIAGWLYSKTRGYEKVFYLSGSTILLSFLVFCLLYFLTQTSNENPVHNDADIELANVEDDDSTENMLLHLRGENGVAKPNYSMTTCNGLPVRETRL